METTIERRLVSTKDAEQVTGMTEKTIRKFLQDGTLPGRKFGRQWRLDLRALDELMRSGPAARQD